MEILSKSKDTTAIIKTFLRYDCLRACVDSLRESYPDMTIFIADDGKLDENEILYYVGLENVFYWAGDFNQGLSYGRNFLINRVKTKYVLIGDDDFVYDKDSGLEKMLDLLDIYDIVGGSIRGSNDYQGIFERVDETLTIKPIVPDYKIRDEVEYADSDIVYNFFVGKTDKVLEVSWDNKIKVIYEHLDFFLRAKTLGVSVGYTPNASIEHRRKTHYDYEDYRWQKSDKKHFFDKWGLRTIIDMEGRIETNE